MIPPGGAITRPLQDVTVAESQTAEFECEVANANAEGKWLKDGQPLDSSENVVSEVKGAVRRLVIVITRPQDVGEYTYQVANSKTSANLKVEGEFLLCPFKEKANKISAIKQAYFKKCIFKLMVYRVLMEIVCFCSGEDQEDFEKPDGDGDPGGRVLAGTHTPRRQRIPVDQERSRTAEQ